MNERQLKWWQTGVIYQIYPRSFQDSNADGVGDLAGIAARLDYLEWLGVTGVWISPVYPSPMADFGYDISDYNDIHPVFGSLADLDFLIEDVHKRGMKLILDFVPNHTSDQHPWFRESRSSRTNAKRDWYIWQDPSPKGGPPNNWLAAFGGAAWEWDDATGQYYYHAFLKEQPDLNWRNPRVRQAMLEAMKFWLDRGVDGFRVDVMWHMIKDEQFRDNPPNPDYLPHMATVDQLLQLYSTDQPEVHDVVAAMRGLLDRYDDRVMIGEIYLPVEKLVSYYGTTKKEAHLPFNFQLIGMPWNAAQIFTAISRYEAAIPPDGWPNWVLGNHDNVRLASRIGMEQARVAAVLLLTLRGTPTMYYGEELGMKDTPIPLHRLVDPQGINMPDKNLSRDPQRTPMQWDGSPFAGFSDTEPWLPVAGNFQSVNVHRQRDDRSSMLSLYRQLIRLRNTEPSLHAGHYVPVFSDNQIIAFKRVSEGSDPFLILLNLTHRPAYFRQVEPSLKGNIILSTLDRPPGEDASGTILLSGDEALIIRLRT